MMIFTIIVLGILKRSIVPNFVVTLLCEFTGKDIETKGSCNCNYVVVVVVVCLCDCEGYGWQDASHLGNRRGTH